MSTLRDYYLKLQEFESATPVDLIAPWQPEVVEAIHGNFAGALASGVLREATVNIPAGTSNQSIGNKIADFAERESIRHSNNFESKAVRARAIRIES